MTLALTPRVPLELLTNVRRPVGDSVLRIDPVAWVCWAKDATGAVALADAPAATTPAADAELVLTLSWTAVAEAGMPAAPAIWTWAVAGLASRWAGTPMPLVVSATRTGVIGK